MDPSLVVTPSQMLYRGLKLVNIDRATQQRRYQSTNATTFRSHHGIHPIHASKIWQELFTTNIAAARVDEGDANLQGFFVALNFLRCHMSESVRSSLFKFNDKKAMRYQIWFWIGKISALKETKILWPTEFDTTFVFSVDGTHIKICEPRDPDFKKNPKWYSHKHGSAGFNVQVVLHLFKQQCCNITISPAGTNDQANLNISGLLDILPEGGKAIVDGGYAEDHPKLSGYNQFDTKLVKSFKARAKSRHETFNARLKIFELLKHDFEYGVQKFPICFEAIAVLVQYTIEDQNPESGNPLFDI